LMLMAGLFSMLTPSACDRSVVLVVAIALAMASAAAASIATMSANTSTLADATLV